MIVTLLTDFGTEDYYVGAMKGAILTVSPDACIVDLTHQIPPHDVEAGAFVLSAASKTFPPGTIHVAVVDPGVGSARRPIIVASHRHTFVGPDNGLFTFVYERDPEARVFHLTNEDYFRSPVSATFHGRDLFAPVAGALANGVALEALGERIDDYIKLSFAAPHRLPDGTLEAAIIHIDRFGNCVTNISRRDLLDDPSSGAMRLIVNGHQINSIRDFFAAQGVAGDELFAVWGSANLLEIAVNRGSAAGVLGAARGQHVLVTTDMKT